MASEPDVIRQREEIEHTREEISKTVEQIEEKVKGTIESVTDKVEDVVETVKEKVKGTVESVTSTVEETVSTVKRTFDIPYQVQRHPWALAGCSLLTGMAVGWFLTGRRRPRGGWSFPPARPEPRRQEAPPDYQPAAAPRYQAPRDEPQQPGLLTRLLSPFESEINKVKETAIGALLGMMRDGLKRALPPNLAANVDEIMDSATRKAGGKPVEGPVLAQEQQGGAGDYRAAGHGRL